MIINSEYFINGMCKISGLDDKSDGVLTDFSIEKRASVDNYIATYEPLFLQQLGMSVKDAQKHLIGENNTSPIVNYVFCMYARDNALEFVNSEDSFTTEVLNRRLISVFNSMVDKCRQLVVDKVAIPPSLKANIFHKITALGI